MYKSDRNYLESGHLMWFLSTMFYQIVDFFSVVSNSAHCAAVLLNFLINNELTMFTGFYYGLALGIHFIFDLAMYIFFSYKAHRLNLSFAKSKYMVGPADAASLPLARHLAHERQNQICRQAAPADEGSRLERAQSRRHSAAEAG